MSLGSYLSRRVLGIAISIAVSMSGALAETKIRFQMPELDGDLQDAILAGSLLASAARDRKVDPQELLADARADYLRIVSILYENGRFGGVVNIFVDGREAAEIPPLATLEEIDEIVSRVQPGRLYRFSDVGIDPKAPNTELPQGFAPGQPAGIKVIRQAADASIAAWRAAGHAKAEVTGQTIVARHSDRKVDARLTVDPGPFLTFGSVSVRGNEDFRTNRILKIAGLEEGRDFDPDDIADTERRLRRTGSFKSVRVVEGEEPTAGNELPLSIEVVEQTPRRFGFGAEYSTFDGLRVTSFWLHRNFLGGAERLRFNAEIAGIGGEVIGFGDNTEGIDYSFGARFERPATPKADIDLFSEFTLEREDEPDYLSNTAEFTLGFTRYATEQLVVDFGVGYLYSDVTDDFGNETYTLLTLPLGAVLDRRRNSFNSKDGYFLDLEVTPYKGLSGTADGILTEIDARGYESFGKDERFTFATRLQLGSLAGADLLETPPIYRFYSGGGGTVRGQDFESLAIERNDGRRTGGRSFFGLSLEARIGVRENIEVVTFYDFGYVGAESFPDFSGNSHAGAGLGLRYVTGIGPLRADLAVPVSGDTEASDFYLYIGIGQAF
jgi:translocation and assembly module TamA